MLERLKNWLEERFSDGAPLKTPRPGPEDVEFDSQVASKLEDGGPGKNTLVRKKYIREETGTYETLKIVDDSLDDSEEGFSDDPYNTGRFDRSKNWGNRFRK